MAKNSEAAVVTYPYIPDNRTIEYVPLDNVFLAEAQEMWRKSGCKKQATGAVVVKDGVVIGRGNNHTAAAVDVCPRDEQGYKTGEGYHLCHDVCKQVGGHSEANAVADATQNGGSANDADLYLFGHWWCCKGCWDAMDSAGIRNVYLLEGADADTDWHKFEKTGE